jgi:hypothetical protein
MITDPVYEGKSMQALIDLVGTGYFPDGSRILYTHLGGAPALNGYAYAFRNGRAASTVFDFLRAGDVLMVIAYRSACPQYRCYTRQRAS